MRLEDLEHPAIRDGLQARINDYERRIGDLERMLGVAVDLRSGRSHADNGAINICQRASSVAGISATGIFTADRWTLQLNTLGTWTMSVETDAPAGTEFKSSLKLLCTTADASPAAGDYAYVSQAIEGQFLQHLLKGTTNAKPITRSFWAKSNVTGLKVAELYDLDNNRWISGSYTINASATWEYKTVTFIGDTTGAFNNDQNASMLLSFWLGAGSTYNGGGALGQAWNTTNNTRAVGQTNIASATSQYLMITGVQQEAGLSATPYETMRFDDELTRAMRYAEKSYNYHDDPGSATTGYTYESCKASSATNIDPGPSIYFKVRKRANPATVSFWRPDGSVGTWLWNAGSGTPILYVPSESGFKTYTTTAAGLTAGVMYTVNGHWFASSDL